MIPETSNRTLNHKFSWVVAPTLDLCWCLPPKLLAAVSALNIWNWLFEAETEPYNTLIY